MVVFSCDGCGEMLKKNQVDGHARRCKNCHSVSCIDCSVAFFGDDYRNHTTCISEAERYEKSDYKPQQKKKKASPQELWMDLIQSSASKAPTHLINVMNRIVSLDNVPRKEKQFRNFVSNSLNLRGNHAEQTVGEIWNFLRGLREKQQQQQQNQPSGNNSNNNTDATLTAEHSKEQENGTVQRDAVAETSTLSSLRENKTTKTTTETCKTSKNTKETKASTKVIKKAMKTVLKKAPNKSLKLGQLQRAVLQHFNEKDQNKQDEQQIKKLIKKNLWKHQHDDDSDKKVAFKQEGKTVTLHIK